MAHSCPATALWTCLSERFSALRRWDLFNERSCAWIPPVYNFAETCCGGLKLFFPSLSWLLHTTTLLQHQIQIQRGFFDRTETGSGNCPKHMFVATRSSTCEFQMRWVSLKDGKLRSWKVDGCCTLGPFFQGFVELSWKPLHVLLTMTFFVFCRCHHFLATSCIIAILQTLIQGDW